MKDPQPPQLRLLYKRALREAREHQKRKQAEEALRALAGRLQATREEERILISREIHDELGEALTGQKIGLSWLRDRLTAPDKAAIPWHEVFAKINSLASLADATADRVRKLCATLRPAVLDDLGLAAAIEWQTQEFRRRTALRCEITALAEIPDIGDERATALFRIFQEILTNVARHSRASKVRISVHLKKRALILRVRDNGKGIAPRQINSKRSLGILGMRERALLLGGELVIRGKPGRGTVAVVTLPLAETSGRPTQAGRLRR